MQDTAKAVLRGKFIGLNANIRWEKNPKSIILASTLVSQKNNTKVYPK